MGIPTHFTSSTDYSLQPMVILSSLTSEHQQVHGELTTGEFLHPIPVLTIIALVSWTSMNLPRFYWYSIQVSPMFLVHQSRAGINKTLIKRFTVTAVQHACAVMVMFSHILLILCKMTTFYGRVNLP